MEILKRISTIVLSIIFFGGPNIHEVDVIKVSNKTNYNIQDINL